MIDGRPGLVVQGVVGARVQELDELLDDPLFLRSPFPLGDKDLVLPGTLFLPADSYHKDHRGTFQCWPIPPEICVEVGEILEIHKELEILRPRDCFICGPGDGG